MDRLLGLAVDHGFDRYIAASCLARLAEIFGTSSPRPGLHQGSFVLVWWRQCRSDWVIPVYKVEMRSRNVGVVGGGFGWVGRGLILRGLVLVTEASSN